MAKLPGSATTPAAFGPWNPGIRSQVPRDLLHLVTIFHPEHVRTSVADAEELRDLTGIELSDLAIFRPQRLALHELLVRVTADLSVPDGSKIEDLGINFRQITRAILGNYIAPRQGEIDAAYDALRRRLAGFIERELDTLFAGPPAAGPPRVRRGLFGMFRRPVSPPAATEPDAGHEAGVVTQWRRRAGTIDDGPEQAAYRALARVVSALLVRHGHVWGGRELVARLATDLACNEAGSEAIGRMLEPLVNEAVRKEGYRLLPRQESPVVMNTKGASASGKSTLRPLQKALAGQIGVRWDEFALISPDIWRKQLLDYAELGPVYKYGGAFTADEVRIIDQKLDRYMARKAASGNMSHLLIDRFRFDSFAPDSDEAGSNLLTRFGHVVYLFFMITPPESLVERAWNRGLDVGRYKAVDDTLAHCVDAYAGMPQLFFTWIRRGDKRLHFEFLDNSVPQGERPRTVAFGTNERLNVLDVKGMLDVERYRRVDVNATSPAALYGDRSVLAPERNTGFLGQCAGLFREVCFADQATGRVYLRIQSGRTAWVDAEALQSAMADADARAGLAAVVPSALGGTRAPAVAPEYLDAAPGGERVATLGRWAWLGPAADEPGRPAQPGG